MGNGSQWDADIEVSADEVQQLIYTQFPLLSAMRIQNLGYGWDNNVYLVGEEFIFRFPRRKIAVDSIRLEGRMLKKLEDNITIPYPKPMFYGEGDRDYPFPFLGYTYVPGEFPIGLTNEQRSLSVSLLAQFLRKLHSFPVGIAQDNGVPVDHRKLTEITQRKEKMQKFLSHHAAHLTEEEYRTIAVYLSQLKIERAQPREVFLHGDLHFKNMLVDKEGKLSGIIDWGDMNIGHPACDLNVAYSYLPPEERKAFFKEYGEVNDETKVLARLIAVYIPMLIWMQAIDDNDTTIAEEAKANIMRALAND